MKNTYLSPECKCFALSDLADIMTASNPAPVLDDATWTYDNEEGEW